MIRLGLLMTAIGLTAGCTTSRKVVVQEGYRGITQAPPGFEPQQPGALTVATGSRSDAGQATPEPTKFP